MSGSPKYSYVVFNAAVARSREEALARRAERRDRRERENARRLAERATRLADELRTSTLARLAPTRELADRVRADVSSGRQAGLADLERQLDALVAEVADGSAVDTGRTMREAERIRTAMLSLREPSDDPAAQRAHALVELRERFAAADHDGRAALGESAAACAALLDELGRAAADPGSTRFDVLLGTVQHDVGAFVLAAGTAGERERTRRRDLEAALDQWAALEERARTAISDAREFAAAQLAESLDQRVAAARVALDGGDGRGALAALALLQQAVIAAETELDELAVAAQQRIDLAQALKSAMAAEGMLFLGGDDEGSRLILRFQRTNGALYTAAVDSAHPASAGATPDDPELAAGDADAANSSPAAIGYNAVISYNIAGETDVRNAAATGDPVCDQTEQFLDLIHGDLKDAGFEAGEILWDGKPPRGSARALPGATATPRAHPGLQAKQQTRGAKP